MAAFPVRPSVRPGLLPALVVALLLVLSGLPLALAAFQPAADHADHVDDSLGWEEPDPDAGRLDASDEAYLRRLLRPSPAYKDFARRHEAPFPLDDLAQLGTVMRTVGATEAALLAQPDDQSEAIEYHVTLGPDDELVLTQADGTPVGTLPDGFDLLDAAITSYALPSSPTRIDDAPQAPGSRFSHRTMLPVQPDMVQDEQGIPRWLEGPRAPGLRADGTLPMDPSGPVFNQGGENTCGIMAVAMLLPHCTGETVDPQKLIAEAERIIPAARDGFDEPYQRQLLGQHGVGSRSVKMVVSVQELRDLTRDGPIIVMIYATNGKEWGGHQVLVEGVEDVGPYEMVRVRNSGSVEAYRQLAGDFIGDGLSKIVVPLRRAGQPAASPDAGQDPEQRPATAPEPGPTDEHTPKLAGAGDGAAGATAPTPPAQLPAAPAAPPVDEGARFEAAEAATRAELAGDGTVQRYVPGQDGGLELETVDLLRQRVTTGKDAAVAPEAEVPAPVPVQQAGGAVAGAAGVVGAGAARFTSPPPEIDAPGQPLPCLPGAGGARVVAMDGAAPCDHDDGGVGLGGAAGCGDTPADLAAMLECGGLGQVGTTDGGQDPCPRFAIDTLAVTAPCQEPTTGVFDPIPPQPPLSEEEPGGGCPTVPSPGGFAMTMPCDEGGGVLLDLGLDGPAVPEAARPLQLGGGWTVGGSVADEASRRCGMQC